MAGKQLSGSGKAKGASLDNSRHSLTIALRCRVELLYSQHVCMSRSNVMTWMYSKLREMAPPRQCLLIDLLDTALYNSFFLYVFCSNKVYCQVQSVPKRRLKSHTVDFVLCFVLHYIH
jgi:hypothetical protein